MSKLTDALEQSLVRSDQSIIYDGRWYRTDEVCQDVFRIRRRIRDLGLKTAQRIILAVPNSYGFAVIYVACLLEGLVIVPTNPSVPCDEMGRVVKRSEAKAAFIASDCSPKDLGPDVDTIISVDELLEKSRETERDVALQTGRNVETDDEWASERPSVEENHPAILMYTSGTTGTPKGVCLTHGQLMAAVRNVVSSHQLTTEDISYLFLPLFHINAQVIVFLSTLVSQGKLVMQSKFSASKFWPVVKDFGVTWVSAVPTVVSILLLSQDSTAAPPSLRFVRSASAPLPVAKLKRFQERFGVPIIESYGMTEAAGQICVNGLSDEDRKLGSVGRPCGIELQVIDDNNLPVENGMVGQIAIRGESIIQAYLEGTARNFHDGWFHTGDLGYQDEDGFVFITGRLKEMINRGGEKIMPREVEEVITRHPAVNVVAVTGAPDELYNERVVAYVVPRTDVVISRQELESELQVLCTKSLAKFKCPSEYCFVESVPLGPTGKIQRHKLREVHQ